MKAVIGRYYRLENSGRARGGGGEAEKGKKSQQSSLKENFTEQSKHRKLEMPAVCRSDEWGTESCTSRHSRHWNAVHCDVARVDTRHREAVAARDTRDAGVIATRD